MCVRVYGCECGLAEVSDIERAKQRRRAELKLQGRNQRKFALNTSQRFMVLWQCDLRKSNR